jgi:hypothetical protein
MAKRDLMAKVTDQKLNDFAEALRVDRYGGSRVEVHARWW